jgi:hypothetical protein
MEDKYIIASRILLDRQGEILRTIRECNEVEEYNALKDEKDHLDEAIFYLGQAKRSYKSPN